MRFDLRAPCKNCPFRTDATAIRFTGRELWGDSAEPGQVLYIDLWESYLEPGRVSE